MKVTEEKVRQGYVRITVEIENAMFIEACQRAYQEMKDSLVKEDGAPMSMAEAIKAYSGALFHGKASAILINETLPGILQERGIFEDMWRVATDVIQIGDHVDLVYTAVAKSDKLDNAGNGLGFGGHGFD